MAALSLALFTGAAALISNTFIAGCIVGVGLAGTAAPAHMWVTQATGTSPQIMGDLAEQWTASELRRLRPRNGWRLINHFGLRPGDIDHLADRTRRSRRDRDQMERDNLDHRPARQRIITAIDQIATDARSIGARGPNSPLSIRWCSCGEHKPTSSQPFPASTARQVVAGPHADEWRPGFPTPG